MADIVPISLGLTEGDYFTLWVPRWEEGDEEWEAFLGKDDELFVFPSVAALVAFVRTDTGHDLADHPSWDIFSGLDAHDFIPTDDHVFDLVSLPELVADSPTDVALAEVGDIFELTCSIGEVCEIAAVDKFFTKHPVLSVNYTNERQFHSRDGKRVWSMIGTAVEHDWDSVLDALDESITLPDVESSAVSDAEEEIAAAQLALASVDVDSEDLDSEDLDSEDPQREDVNEDTEDEVSEQEEENTDVEEKYDEEDSLWTDIGIDPIKIVTTAGDLFTLRCYLDNEPIFLGREGSIYVFGSGRSLLRYLADDHDHELAEVSTYDQLRLAVLDGFTDVEIAEENVYILTGIADDLIEGPDLVDRDQLELAVELFTDAADFAGDASVEKELSPSATLGRLVTHILSPKEGRIAPPAPYDSEAGMWKTLELGFESRLSRRS